MRAALWLLSLFALAAAGAWFAGNNQGTVTLYWPPYRVDLSLNLVVLLLVFAFFNSAVIWMLLEAKFLAVVLVLVVSSPPACLAK